MAVEKQIARFSTDGNEALNTMPSNATHHSRVRSIFMSAAEIVLFVAAINCCCLW